MNKAPQWPWRKQCAMVLSYWALDYINTHNNIEVCQMVKKIKFNKSKLTLGSDSNWCLYLARLAVCVVISSSSTDKNKLKKLNWWQLSMKGFFLWLYSTNWIKWGWMVDLESNWSNYAQMVKWGFEHSQALHIKRTLW